MEPGFGDTETTGLDPDLHEVWEVALILGPDRYVWQLPVDIDRADPKALEMNGFDERRWPLAHTGEQVISAVHGAVTDEHPDGPGYTVHPYYMGEWAERLCKLTDRWSMAGGNWSFDEERLRRFCQRYGHTPTWHYRPLCAQQVLYGYLLGLRAAGALPDSVDPEVLTVPWHSDSLLAAVGVEHGRGRHTAMGDAEIFQRAWRLAHEGLIP